MEDDFEFADHSPPSFQNVDFSSEISLSLFAWIHSRCDLLSAIQLFLGFGNVVKDVEARGFNPGLIVLLVVGGLVLAFLIGNYALYMYAQKTLPPKKKKPISKKKMKKERLKQGVSAPGE
ncbi:DNA-binding protein S1FA isoform X1 [Hevea brasiliensis]|nr:DNA-binding protein S1FA isoform X1 [Hevea brasiliensis]